MMIKFVTNNQECNLDSFMLDIHDNYISIDDFAILENKATLGLFRKKFYKKFTKIANIYISPVSNIIFKDTEGIGFYSINELTIKDDVLCLSLNENNQIYINTTGSMVEIGIV